MHQPKVESAWQSVQNKMFVVKHLSMPLESNKSMKDTLTSDVLKSKETK